MKIATWNIERLEHKNRLDDIIAVCEHENADILVLTEADLRVKFPQYPFCCSTMRPLDHELPHYSVPVHYMSSERRVIIYSRYPYVKQYNTYDGTTAVCVELETEKGSLLVYGVIIGIHGHRKPFFTDALHGQMKDLKKLTAQKLPICFLGDYNCSFADNYYPSNIAKTAILECFAETGMTLLTEKQLECICCIKKGKEYPAIGRDKDGMYLVMDDSYCCYFYPPEYFEIVEDKYGLLKERSIYYSYMGGKKV